MAMPSKTIVVNRAILAALAALAAIVALAYLVS